MKKKYTDKDIERFFEAGKSLEPIFDNKKVHQIINTPKAMARLGGKPFKPLKFIIMTTFAAIIISAILFWPGENKTSPSIENGSSLNMHSTEQNIPENNENENAEQFVIDEYDEIEEEPQVPDNSLKLEEEVKSEIPPKDNEELNHSSEIQDTNSYDNIDPDTIKTRKGDIKQLIADQELLEKLGFTFKDRSVYYKNMARPGNSQSYSFVYYEKEKATYSSLFGLSSDYVTDSVDYTRNSFYPVAQTYNSDNVKHSIYDHESFDIESAVDTLFPVFIPHGLIDNDANDFVLWFHVNQAFFDILPEKFSLLNEAFEKRKKIKRIHPDLQLVDYKTASIIDPSRFVELSVNDLSDMGFSLVEDSTMAVDQNANQHTRAVLEFSDSEDKPTVKFEIGKSGKRSTVYHNDNQSPLIFVTRTNGEIIYTNRSKNDIENIVPIIVRQESYPSALESDLLYWFLPSEFLFSNLPEHIANDLKDEYNYIIAENKSELVKPDCNFYEECRNTLLINDFKVYPNPANQFATVSFELPKAIEGRISLIDLQGRERIVLLEKTRISPGYQHFKLDISGISEGIYLITLFSDSGIQTQRLVIQH